MSEFSPQARETLQFARTEAHLLQTECVSSGYLLLGLMRQEMDGSAPLLFSALGVHLEQARAALVTIDTQRDTLTRFTPETRRAIHLAADLAQNRQQLTGASHFLLALLLLPENQASQMMAHLGINLETLRIQTLHTLPPENVSAASPPARIHFQASHQRNKFTQRARQALYRAGEEAWMFEQSIDLEHLFLGLLYESQGVAFQILKELNLDLDAIDRVIAQHLGRRDGGNLVMTPRGKRSIELAVREAFSLGHRYLGTEHLLLGLLRLCEEEQNEGGLFASLSRNRKRENGKSTASFFASLGLSYKRARQQMSVLLAHGRDDDTTTPLS